MQPFKWYVQRLKRMSPSEVVWRVYSLGRDVVDRYRVALNLYPNIETAKVSLWKRGFQVQRNTDRADYNSKWKTALLERAETLLDHKFSFFRFNNEPFGDSIDWHRDYNLGIRAPVTFAASIDYRNAHEAGDCKLVWEHNRHQHLVVLARAYRVSGDEKYVQEIVAQLRSWLEANPFGYGMNWRSPMEQGIRLINWIWLLDFIEGAEALTEAIRAEILYSIYLHCWDTQRKYSQGSSANNHLIGEAAGVFIATAYFKGMPNGERWYQDAKEILEREIIAQTYDSGCSKEHTFGYPYFVIQFFITCGLTARWLGDDFSPQYWQRLEQMIEFMGRLTQGGQYVPMIGDADDGYVLDLDDGQRDYRYILATGAVLFNRPDFKAWCQGRFSESAWWWLGSSCHAAFNALEYTDNTALLSASFEDAGYHLLQCGDQSNGISVLFDCAELGYGPIAAHGHADALSIVVRAFGYDLLVDPGTYDYYTYPEWRDYFRSTLAHNTVGIDGEEQSEMQGRFLWGRRAKSKLIAWEASDNRTKVVGEHDGYGRLADPVIHRRTLELTHEARTLTIIDEVKALAAHDVTISFQLGEQCEIESLGDAQSRVKFAEHAVDITFDPRLQLSSVKGCQSPIGGWVSRGYHRKEAAPMIIAQASISGSNVFITTVKFMN